MVSRRTLTAVLLLLVASHAGAHPVRFFAVGHKLRVDDAVNYQAYRDKLAALMDATFPGRSTFVQDGVDDVASHLRPADAGAPADALVVFPEDTGLVAALIGTRGATSRTQTSTAAGIVLLSDPYAAQRAYYDGRFPGQPFVRNLVLALTDTLYRSFYESFRDLAMSHHVWIAASANLAPARRVEAADDPDLVATLRDPDEPGRTYAYEAIAATPTNTTFVFTPDGDVIVPDGHGGTRRAPGETGGVLRGSTDKAYLTPIEQPPPGNDAGLALAFGAVRDLEVLDTPVGRLGIVISKDAWMVDVNDRFFAKGANVILQPEAFSTWAYDTVEWAPDVFTSGGYANLQKHPSFVANVDASMTGNLFDTTFDGQSAILGRETKSPAAGPLSATNAWVGRNPATGFLAVAPWIVPDPGITNPTLTLSQRRDALAGAGAPLLPGSGVACGGSLVVGSCENGYREAIVWADVEVPDGVVTAAVDATRATPPAFSDSVLVSGVESTPTAQHAPRVATHGRDVFVVWHQAAAGAVPNVWMAISHDGGRRFGAPQHVSDVAAGTATELNPALAVRGDTVFVTWQQFTIGRSDDTGRICLARFDARGRKLGSDVLVDDDTTAGKWRPAIAMVGSAPVVAWIDERDRGPEGEPLEHVYFARGRRGGRVFERSTRLDAGTAVPLAAHLDNTWSPTLLASGATVVAAWADFRNYNWDIFSTRSTDRGRTFAANVRVDDYPDFERINDQPGLAIGRGGTIHAVWSDIRAREPDANIFYTRSAAGGPSFEPSRQLDDSRTGFDPDHATPNSQWRPTLAASGDRLFVAWQDHRLGNADVFFTSSRDGGSTFAPSERVDDSGAGNSTQTTPSIAIAGKGSRRTCYVAWEDDRDGTSDIRLARRPCGGR